MINSGVKQTPQVDDNINNIYLTGAQYTKDCITQLKNQIDKSKKLTQENTKDILQKSQNRAQEIYNYYLKQINNNSQNINEIQNNCNKFNNILGNSLINKNKDSQILTPIEQQQ